MATKSQILKGTMDRAVDAYHRREQKREAVEAMHQRDEEARATLDVGEAIDLAILEFVEKGELSLGSKVTIDGHSFQLDVVRVPEDHEQQSLPVIRNVKTSPLESLFHRKDNPIELYQYLAGCRFRVDWYGSQISPMRAVDVAQATLYATEAVMKAYRDGYSGPGAGAPLRAVAGLLDSRIDAQRRLGDACAAISDRSVLFARKVIGEEWSLRRLAVTMQWDDRYVAQRMREALDELARHYSMIAGARRKRNTKP